MHLDAGHIAMMTAIAGKGFIMLARSQPPLPKDAGYFRTWIHDFIQQAASNDDKIQNPHDFEKEKPAPNELQSKSAAAGGM
jgi:hypothetical protein